MSKIPYCDYDNRPLDYVTPEKAEAYISAGVAKAVRQHRDGRIVLLKKLPRERVYAKGSDALGSASQTTQRLRDDGGALIAPPKIREHNMARCMAWRP
jgi:hypothetical protein